MAGSERHQRKASKKGFAQKRLPKSDGKTIAQTLGAYCDLGTTDDQNHPSSTSPPWWVAPVIFVGFVPRAGITLVSKSGLIWPMLAGRCNG
jgi:hypothetical protein